eukprot:10849165-Alexandrium_andersonii.AAC.1
MRLADLTAPLILASVVLLAPGELPTRECVLAAAMRQWGTPTVQAAAELVVPMAAFSFRGGGWSPSTR